MNFSELLVIALVAFLVLGPKQLATLAHRFGHFIGQAKRLSATLDQQTDFLSKEEQLKKNIAKAMAAEEIQQRNQQQENVQSTSFSNKP